MEPLKSFSNETDSASLLDTCIAIILYGVFNISVQKLIGGLTIEGITTMEYFHQLHQC